MGQRGSKHQNVKTMTASFSGGLNLHDSAINIQDNQLRDARNFYYADRGAALVTRPGIKPVLGAPMGKATLTVILYPANTGGWRLSGETAWRSGGDSILLDFGTYTVEFMTVDGYTPPSQNTTIIHSTSLVSGYADKFYLGDIKDAAHIWIPDTGSKSLSRNVSVVSLGRISVGRYIGLISFKLGAPKGAFIGYFSFGMKFSEIPGGSFNYNAYCFSPNFDPQTGSVDDFYSVLSSSSSNKINVGRIDSTTLVNTYYYDSPNIASVVQNAVSSNNYTSDGYVTIAIADEYWGGSASSTGAGTFFTAVNLVYSKYFYY